MRTPAEYETAHVPGSINIPLPVVIEHAPELAGPVVLVCPAGARARTAHTAPAAAGGLVATGILAGLRFPEARTLAGGTGAGLATAAITDTCAMGAALSRLPSNRGGRAVTLPEAAQVLRASGSAAS